MNMQQRMAIGTLIFLVAAGCGRSKPPPANLGGPAPPALVPAAPADGPEALTPAGPAFQGKSAKQWDELLDARDTKTCAEAAVALGNMGEAGYPYLAARLKAGSDQVRLQSLLAIGRGELVAHARQTMPLLMEMLDARNPSLRQAAASRLAWYGADSKQALQPLERVARADSDPEVRRVAAGAIAQINEFFDAQQRLADYERNKKRAP
jgi:HEAT repeats